MDEPDIITLIERNQSEMNIYCMILLIGKVQKKKIRANGTTTKNSKQYDFNPTI